MGPIRGIIIIFIVTKLVEAKVWKLSSGNIVAGVGYSSDSQQIAAQICYNAKVSSISEQRGYAQLDTAQSFSDLENVLGISVNIGGKYGAFSAEAKASYMRSIQDKDYSMSLNYYQYATNNVAVQLAGHGEEALTEFGRSVYNGSKNPHFGLLCGDYFIASYKQGAFLTMGLNIKFSSSYSKKEFLQKAGFSFGDIVSAAESVKSLVTEYRISGSVSVQAFQMGGEPSQLAKVFTNDSTGQYYALQCSLTEMDKCIRVASGLLHYAGYEFSTQFSTVNNTGLTPLGIAFTQPIPIKYIGLTPPDSLVTAEVVQYRNELFSKLRENEYYQQKLYPFFNKGYPVELDDAFMINASLILSKANRNVATLMKVPGGAADCFNFPDMCKSIKTDIDSQLENITTNDLKFLEAVKYTLTVLGGMFYNTGEGAKSWHAVPVPTKLAPLFKVILVDGSAYCDNRVYIYDAETNYIFLSQYSHFVESHYEGYSTGSNMTTYVGNLLSKDKGSERWTKNMTNHEESKVMSPFFFDAYNVTKWGD